MYAEALAFSVRKHRPRAEVALLDSSGDLEAEARRARPHLIVAHRVPPEAKAGCFWVEVAEPVGGEGAKALAELGSAAGQLAGLLQDAKDNPNGAVHQLFYGDAGTMFADLGSAAADIKQITGMVARGEGSLGGLIKDPTVYEDLRLVVGNVRRNKVLRALVRFAINNNAQAEEQVAQPIVVPPEKAQRGIGGAGAPSEEQPKGSPLILPLPPPVP